VVTPIYGKKRSIPADPIIRGLLQKADDAIALYQSVRALGVKISPASRIINAYRKRLSRRDRQRVENSFGGSAAPLRK